MLCRQTKLFEAFSKALAMKAKDVCDNYSQIWNNHFITHASWDSTTQCNAVQHNTTVLVHPSDVIGKISRRCTELQLS